MTHEEQIALLTGEYLQVSQYTIYSAFKATSLYLRTLTLDQYRHGVEEMEVAFADADEKLKKSVSLSSEELISYFKDKGLSKKLEKQLFEVINKRSYLSSLFFIEHSNDFASQDVVLYDKIIDELYALVKEASEVNQELAKTIEKFSDSFGKF